MQEKIKKDSKKDTLNSVIDLDDEILINVSGGDYHVVKVPNNDFYAVVDEDGDVWDYYNTKDDALQVAKRKNN